MPPLAIAARTLPWADSLEVTVKRVQGPGVRLSGVTAAVRGSDLELRIADLAAAGWEARDVRVSCRRFRLQGSVLDCPDGALATGVQWPLRFRYDWSSGALDFTLRPGPDETLSGETRLVGGERLFRLEARQLALARLAAWLPKDFPAIRSGRLDGQIELRGDDRRRFEARFELRELAFSDAAGVRAGENIRVDGRLEAEGDGPAWTWRAAVNWLAGEVFWQPVFGVGRGHDVTLQGRYAASRLDDVSGAVRITDVGTLEFDLAVDLSRPAQFDARVRARELDAGNAYRDLLKAMLAATPLADLRVTGHLDLEAQWVGGALRAAAIGPRLLSFEDNGRRFGVFGLEGDVAWDAAQVTHGELRFQGAEVLRLRVGAARLPLQLRGEALRFSRADIPLLDGTLVLDRLAARREVGQWRWSFAAELRAVSMEELTAAFGLPTMYGTLSGTIPRATYADATLILDGSLEVGVFDGRMSIANLKIGDLFGRAPVLNADVSMRNLDLDLVTRAFSFGSITGRIDADFNDLELIDWQPTRFDARLASSPGEYPRRISQTAVQNISALGGSGATGAIQRSLLRFFDQFRYDRIGWSCRLLAGVCEMGGIEPSPSGGYVLIKGGGLPSITVLGYNQLVGWHELVERLKRVTQENVQPTVR